MYLLPALLFAYSSVTLGNTCPEMPRQVEDSLLGLTYTPSSSVPYASAEGRTDFNWALRPIGTVRAAMIFAHFPNTTKEENPRDLYQQLVPKAVECFRKSSEGKLKLVVDPYYDWVPMDKPSTWPDYNPDTGPGYTHCTSDPVQKLQGKVDFTQYDIVYVVLSNAPKVLTCAAANIFEADAQAAGLPYRHVVLLGTVCRDPFHGMWQTVLHETSHLFGLPDLYKAGAKSIKDAFSLAGSWDPMSLAMSGPDFLTWQKHKVGWLPDRAFRLVREGHVATTIAPSGGNTPYRAVVVPTSSSTAYVAEVRTIEDAAGTESGVLLYKVDLTKSTGNGSITVIPAKQDSPHPERERRYLTLYNALYASGRILDDPQTGTRIDILRHEDLSFTLEVTKQR